MTCVAAWIDRDAGRVHMAADTLALDGGGVTMHVSKLVDFGRGVVAGVAGQCASIPLLRRSAVTSPCNSDDRDEWAQDVAERITALQLKAGIVADDDARSAAGLVLLAHGGGLWEVTTNLAVPIRRRYHAIGSGDTVALGALWALTQGRAGPHVAGEAVEAAIEHQVDVGGTVETLHT